MTLETKNELIRNLNKLKSYGYEYIQPLKLNESTNIGSLPNDLCQLATIVQNCNLCELSKQRKNVVFGEGDIKAKVMFIGEAPGATEDDTGRPFVGRAGQLLTKMIENVLNIKRSEVYIANVVKCRPPNNRVPQSDEVNLCKPYLDKQIKLISPKLIVALGKTSYTYLTNDETAISKVRGKVIEYNGLKILPTFHPSFLLRNPSAKKDAYHDMLKIKSMIEI